MHFAYGTKQHWDSVARTRAAQGTAASDAMAASVLAAAAPDSGSSCLDVGTGLGKLPLALAQRGVRRAVGIDVSPAGIDAAREHARGVLGEAPRFHPEFFAMDAARLDFDAGSFDIVTCLKTIWCVPSAELCLAEWRRVSRPGARLVVQIYGPQEECPLLVLGPHILSTFAENVRMPSNYRGPFDFTPARLSGLLHAAGFEAARFEEHALEVTLRGASEYWQILRSIAGSAYYAYSLLAEAHGAAIDRAFERRTARVRADDGTLQLGLTWLVCTAEARP